MEAAGIELPPKTSGKTAFSEKGGAESGALSAQSGPPAVDLRALIDAWPRLPRAVRAGILAIVGSLENKPSLQAPNTDDGPPAEVTR